MRGTGKENSITQLRVSSGKRLGVTDVYTSGAGMTLSPVGTPESRLQAVACNRHAADGLLHRKRDLDLWEVIGQLSEEIELAARCQPARRLARSDQAPIHMVNKLAFDDLIDVAGPILRYSERLENQVLVTNARCKSQQHLFAISRRKSIDEPVTDVLVERGDQTVGLVAVNTGRHVSRIQAFCN